MLIDNKTKFANSRHNTMFEYLQKELGNGDFEMVSGYYTIDTLRDFVPQFEVLKSVKMILGRLPKKPIPVLPKFLLPNQISPILKLTDLVKITAKNHTLLEIIKNDKVQIGTVAPSFCHAKVYCYSDKDTRRNFAINGSSNFTASGLGRYPTANLELNTVFESTNNDGDEIKKWYADLAQKAMEKQAESKANLLKEISSFGMPIITPRQMYGLILWRLFGQQTTTNEITLPTTHYTDSQIYKTLYEWQQAGVNGLINRLENFGVAILADGVGLGKTWQTLAIIKYFQGRSVLVISPKNLMNNWQKYTTNNHRFESDNLGFKVCASSQIRENNGKIETDKGDDISKFDLIILDESHNYRNPKSNIYQKLQTALSMGKNTKLLMLSATPVNNKLEDLWHQIALGFCHNDQDFEAIFDIPLGNIFSECKTVLKEAVKNRDADITAKLPPEFINLLDTLSICRSKGNIKKFFPDSVNFPLVETSGVYLDEFEEFLNELFDKSGNPKVNFAIYKPRKYLQEKALKEEAIGSNLMENDIFREMSLSKMMMINLVKRLESSTFSFVKTLDKIITYHKVLQQVMTAYKSQQESLKLEKTDQKEIANLEKEIGKLRDKIENSTLGVFALVSSVFYKSDDQKELEVLEKKLKDLTGREFYSNIDLPDLEELFEGFEQEEIEGYKKHFAKLLSSLNNPNLLQDGFEIGIKKPINYKNLHYNYRQGVEKDLRTLGQIRDSVVAKLQKSDAKMVHLLTLIKQKLLANPNQKILIFSNYKDTADYIFANLDREFKNIKLGLVTGNTQKGGKDKEAVLRSFSPNSKIFNELTKEEQAKYTSFEDFWQNYTGTEKQHPIQILVATDCISEGQNLQDCDLSINYDIHWNPVKLIQRNGRIDRIGSTFDKIEIVNFWPGKSLDDILSLKSKIEYKMALVSIAGGVEEDTELVNALKIIEKYCLKNNVSWLETSAKQVNLPELLYARATALLDGDKLNTEKDYSLIKQMATDSHSFENNILGDLGLDFYQQDLAKLHTTDENIQDYDKYPILTVSGQNFEGKKGVIFLFQEFDEDLWKLQINEPEEYKESKDTFKNYLVFADLQGKIIYSHKSKGSSLQILKEIVMTDPAINCDFDKNTAQNYQDLFETILAKTKENLELESKNKNKKSKKLTFAKTQVEYQLTNMFIVK